MRSVTRPHPRRHLPPRVWGAAIVWLSAVLLLLSACGSSSTATAATSFGSLPPDGLTPCMQRSSEMHSPWNPSSARNKLPTTARESVAGPPTSSAS